MLVYPSAMPVSTKALTFVSDALRAHRRTLGTRWRRLTAGDQALMLLAHLRKGETYRDLAAGFGVGVATAYRHLREGLDVLAALAPTLQQAMQVAARKAYVVLDGTLLRIDRVAMASGGDRPYLPGARHDAGAAAQHAIPAALAAAGVTAYAFRVRIARTR